MKTVTIPFYARGRALTALAGAALLLAMTGCHAPGAATGVPAAGEPGGASGGEATHLIKYGGQSGVAMEAGSSELAGIQTVTVGLRELSQSLQPTGQVVATDSNSAQVTARLPGRVVEARVAVGATVHRGEVVAMVDSVDLTQAESTYQTALSHFKLSADQLDQERKLAKFGTISEQPIEDARRAYSAAQAAVAQDVAQLQVDHVALANTRQLVKNGELTRKPLDDAQNAYAQAQSALEQSKVSLDSTKATLDRTKSLFDSGIYSKQQLEDAQTAYDTARAAVSQNETQESLAKDELARQHNIFERGLNASSAMQPAQTKLEQDQHGYQNDLVTVETSRKELARAQVVHQSGIPVSQALQQAQDTYDEAQSALRGAVSTLRLYGVSPGQTLAQLGNGHVVIPVTAPITGVVVSRTMVVGQMTDTSTPLVQIVNLDRVYVDAQIYEQDLPKVAVGDITHISVDAFPDRRFDGRIAYIGQQVSADTRTVTVRTEAANPGWLLRPGMFATVLISQKSALASPVIPADAVLPEGENSVVFQEVAPRQYVKRLVRVGPAQNGEVPVLSGLEPGAKVVTDGNFLLQNTMDKLKAEQGEG